MTDLRSSTTADATADTDRRTTRTRPAVLIGLSTLAGILLSVVWSAPFVDTTIGATLADGMLGYDSKATSIAGSLGGLLFAFAAGLGGTFTACNIAAFSAIAPMLGEGSSAGSRVRAAVRPLWWVAVGMVPLSAAYGAAGALLGDRLPQLSAETVGPNEIPVRLLQSIVVFSLLGVVFIYLGLVALDVAPDPLRRLAARWPQAPLVVMGVLIALFLVGRPYPLFYKMFQYAADDRNPLYGALAFTLVSIGNVLVLGVVFVLLALLGGRRLQRWFTNRPARVASITAAALVVAGVFTLVYWGVRLPARFDYGWFPTAPWNG